MFIVWGSRVFHKLLGRTQQRVTCGNCNNENWFEVSKITKWFTIFFIPVFPFSFKYFVSCPICDRGNYITETEAKNLIELP